MPKYVITKQAEIDLENIFDYIAKDNKNAALKHHNQFLKLFSLIAENPHIGTLREDFGHKVRIIPMGNYLIFHKLSSVAEILRVIHGARNIDSSLIS